MEKKRHNILLGEGTTKPFLATLKHNKVNSFVARYDTIGNVDKVLKAIGTTKSGIEISTSLWLFNEPAPELKDAYIRIQVSDMSKDDFNNYMPLRVKARAETFIF